MSEPFQQLLPYLLPPIIGAFIGYVTNYIAIRMLFVPSIPGGSSGYGCR